MRDGKQHKEGGEECLVRSGFGLADANDLNMCCSRDPSDAPRQTKGKAASSAGPQMEKAASNRSP